MFPRGRVGGRNLLLCEVSEGCLRYEARAVEPHRGGLAGGGEAGKLSASTPHPRLRLWHEARPYTLRVNNMLTAEHDTRILYSFTLEVYKGINGLERK